MINEESFKKLKRQTAASAALGLIMVFIYHNDPPGTTGAAFAIRFCAGINLFASVIGLFAIMWGYRLKEQKK